MRTLPHMLSVSALALAACSGGADPTVTAEIVSYDGRGLVLAARTSPGCVINVRGQEATADESGQVTITVPIDQLHGRDVALDSSCPALFDDTWAFTRIDLPFSAEVAKTLPSDRDADWVRVVAVADHGEIGIKLDGALAADLYQRTDGKTPIPLDLLGKPGLAVEIAGIATTLDAQGRARLDLPVRALVVGLTAAAFEGYEHAVELPVRIGTSGAEERLRVTISGVRRLVANHLAAVAGGEKVPADTPDAVRAVAVVDPDDGALALDAEATVGEVDVVAIMKDRGRRQIEPCVYDIIGGGGGSFSVTPTLVDATVTAFDLRTGEALGDKELDAVLADCPGFINDNESITKRVDPASALSWVQAIAAGGSGRTASAVEALEALFGDDGAALSGPFAGVKIGMTVAELDRHLATPETKARLSELGISVHPLERVFKHQSGALVGGFELDDKKEKLRLVSGFVAAPIEATHFVSRWGEPARDETDDKGFRTIEWKRTRGGLKPSYFGSARAGYGFQLEGAGRG